MGQKIFQKPDGNFYIATTTEEERLAEEQARGQGLLATMRMAELIKRLDATGFGWRLTSVWFSWGRRYVCQIGDLEADIDKPCNYFGSDIIPEAAIRQALGKVPRRQCDG